MLSLADAPPGIVQAGAVVAGFVQGLSGFAVGLVALAFWNHALPPPLSPLTIRPISGRRITIETK